MSNLQMIRKARGLSQEELARKAGISLKTVCALEQGQRSVNEAKMSTLAALGNVLKVDCRIFCGSIFDDFNSANAIAEIFQNTDL